MTEKASNSRARGVEENCHDSLKTNYTVTKILIQEHPEEPFQKKL